MASAQARDMISFLELSHGAHGTEYANLATYIFFGVDSWSPLAHGTEYAKN